MKLIKYSLITLYALTPSLALAEREGAGPAAFVGVLFAMILMFYLAFFAFAIFMFVFWILMLVDAAQRTNWQDENDKTVWILIIVLTGAIGAAIYYFMIKRKLGPNHPAKKA